MEGCCDDGREQFPTFLAQAALGEVGHLLGTSALATKEGEVGIRHALEVLSGGALALWDRVPLAGLLLLHKDLERPGAVVEPGVGVWRGARDDDLDLVCRAVLVNGHLRGELVSRLIVRRDDLDVDDAAGAVKERAGLRDVDGLGIHAAGDVGVLVVFRVFEARGCLEGVAIDLGGRDELAGRVAEQLAGAVGCDLRCE